MKGKTPHLNKSVTIYRIYAYSLLVSLISIFVKPLFTGYNFLFDFLIAFPILMTAFLAPIGLYYANKSRSQKESKSTKRLRFFIGHLFFSFITIAFMIISFVEVFSEFKR